MKKREVQRVEDRLPRVDQKVEGIMWNLLERVNVLKERGADDQKKKSKWDSVLKIERFGLNKKK